MSVEECVLELGDHFRSTEMDYSYPKDDLFGEFSTVFDIPLPSNEELDNRLPFDSALFDSLMDVDENKTQWPEAFPSLSDNFDCGLNSELMIKSECETPSDSPRSLSSSDSCSSSDFKFTLETPPISPPRLDASPPVVDLQPSPNPASQVGKKSTILKINPNNIKIIPYTANIKGLKTVGKQTQIVLPKEIIEKVEKIKKESELSSQVEISKNPKQPQLVYSNPITVPQCGTKDVQSNITIVPTNAKIITLDSSNGPLKILHGARSITPCFKQEPPDVKRDELTLKALKKQQRMIKNRESACLSRKKKKEYVTNLESKLKDLEHENCTLKLENEMLKARIKELESSSFSIPKKSQSAFINLRKTTAVLAVLLMVSVNIGSLSLIHKDGMDAEFKMDSSGLGNSKSRHYGRTLLWAIPDEGETPVNASSKPPTCPLYINQTESLRLEKELRRWIAVDGERGREKNSSRKTLNKPSLRQLILHTPSLKPWKNQRMQRKVDNAVELYTAPFPGSLPRRDDTFYVVSFSSDHLLLPAIAHNITLRPKMSLVLPTIPVNDSVPLNEAIPMMQIDCEVLATRSVQLTGKDINLLKQRRQPNKGNGTDQVAVKDSQYRPYFVRPSKPSASSEFDHNFDSYVNRVYRAANAFP